MAEAQYVPSHSETLRVEPPLWARVVGLAEGQHAVVSLQQLLEFGATASGIRTWVQRGRLRRLHRGVYAVPGARLTRHARWLAAVLACGPRAALSHPSAAVLRGLRPGGGGIHVSVPRASVRALEGVTVHATKTLKAHDVTTVEGIPCTTVARTLVDMGDVTTRREVELAVNEAELLRLFDLTAAEEVLGRAGPRKGAGVLRAVLADLAQPTLTNSRLEEAFLALCRRHRLPSPEVNAWITLDDGAVKPDFLWRDQRLAIETDGHSVHSTRQSFESDRLRDQRLALAGYLVLRFTWRQVEREPARVASTVRALLATR